MATTYYVSLDGSDSNTGLSLSAPFLTLRKGVSMLLAGDTLWVRVGTYTGLLNVIDSSLFVINGGTDFGFGVITIGAYQGEPVTLQPPDGFSAIKLASGSQNGAAGNKYIIFQDLVMDGVNQTSSVADGVYFNAGSNHIRLLRNEVKNWIGNGIATSEHNWDSPWASYFEFIDNVVHNNGRGTGSFLIHGMYLQTSNNLYDGNRSYHNSGYGMQLDDNAIPTARPPSNNIVRNNVLYDNGVGTAGTGGLVVAFGANNQVYNNLIYDNNGSGILVYTNSSNTSVFDNTIYNNSNAGVAVQFIEGDVTIRNNILYNNQGGPIQNNGGFSGGSIIADHNLVIDPLFVDAATQDFRVKPLSPAIDAGIGISFINSDLPGNPRPTSGPCTIGAYEFVGSQDLGLLHSNSLRYQGAFRVPDGIVGSSTFAFGGFGLTYNPANNSLFLGGSPYQNQVAEITIPAAIIGAFAGLNIASIVQTFADPTRGHLLDVGTSPTDTVSIGGMLPYGGKLLLCAYLYYDASGGQTLSHFVCGIDFSIPNDVTGPWQVGPTGMIPGFNNAGFVDGFMCTVPSNWQSALGGPVLTGQSSIPIVARTSWGPAAFAINPANFGAVIPIPATPLLYYTGNHPTIGTYGGPGLLWNGVTQMGGMVFPDNTDSVLFFGRVGLGPFCYGEATTDPNLAGTLVPGSSVDIYCFDPAIGSKGTHGYPYAYFVWAYNAADLQAVKDGSKQPWELVPYDYWELEFPGVDPEFKNIFGVAWNPTAGFIYLAQQPSVGSNPLIHVFAVVAGTGGGNIGSGASAVRGPKSLGTGKPTLIGTGASAVKGPSVVGSGAGQSATGTGASSVRGPGSLGTGLATTTGSGTASVKGPGTLGSGSGVVSGSGASKVLGSSTIGSGSGVDVTGTGASAVAGPSTLGSGTPTVSGDGVSSVLGPTTSGLGTVTPSGAFCAFLTCSALAAECQPSSVGTIGQAFDSTVLASGGAAPYHYAVVSGALPPGLILNATTGEITGVPLTTGTFNFTIRVVDSEG